MCYVIKWIGGKYTQSRPMYMCKENAMSKEIGLVNQQPAQAFLGFLLYTSLQLLRWRLCICVLHVVIRVNADYVIVSFINHVTEFIIFIWSCVVITWCDTICSTRSTQLLSPKSRDEEKRRDPCGAEGGKVREGGPRGMIEVVYWEGRMVERTWVGTS